MGVDRRLGGVWVVSDSLATVDDVWTGRTDNVWHRVGGTWVQVQPRAGVGASAVNPVENLRLDDAFADNPTRTEVHVEWDLPAQTTEPNEVWTRVPVLAGDIWSTLPYPSTLWSHLALDTGTTYTLDVKLVLRDGPVVIAESPIRSFSFTTDHGGVTYPEDPGPTPENPPLVIDPPPSPPGITCGTYTYDIYLAELQEDVVGEPTWVLVETHTGLPAGTANWTFTYAYAPGMTYKACVRGVCDGVPGTYLCGEPFWVPTTPDPCADHDDPVWADAPWADATFIIPKICTPSLVHDVVSDILLPHGPLWGWVTPGHNGPESKALQAAGLDGHTWGDIVAGDLAAVSDIGPSASLVVWITLDGDVDAGDVDLVLHIGEEVGLGVKGGVLGNQPYAYAYAGGYTGTEALGNVAFAEGTVARMGAVFNATTHEIRLFLDGAFVNTTPWAGTVSLASDRVRVRGGTGSVVEYATGWDRALTDDEMITALTPTKSFDELVLSMPNVLHYWPMNDKDTTGFAVFDNILLATPNLLHYWPMNDADTISYANFDVTMIAMPNLFGYWPMNDLD